MRHPQQAMGSSMASNEFSVCPQRIRHTHITVQHPARQATGCGAEVQGRADALAAEGQALPGCIADSEDLPGRCRLATIGKVTAVPAVGRPSELVPDEVAQVLIQLSAAPVTGKASPGKSGGREQPADIIRTQAG